MRTELCDEFGIEYPIFAFTHCRDVVAAADRECNGEVFHVASGRETRIGDLADRMLALTGATIPVRHEPARAGEVRRNVARIDHARAVLGFEARTALDEGLAATWEWFRTQRAA